MRKELRAALKGVVGGLIVLALVFSGLFIFYNQSKLQDFLNARIFEPQPEIVEIEKNLNLTAQATTIFRATHPTVEDRAEFNNYCAQSEHTDEGTVLGCYVSDSIHMFDIEDERLEGIMEVTAAHELLHAIYSRQTVKQKDALQEQLLGLYEEVISENSSFEKRMSVYSHLSEERFANELHSIFGTELEILPGWIEEHYSKWFENRLAIVEFFEGYSDYFDELREQGEKLVEKLALLSEQIDYEVQVYTDSVQTFNREFENFLRRNDSYAFQDNPDEFYSLKDSFDSRRYGLNEEKVLIDQMIEEYNELQLDLESLNLITKELKQSLDSTLLPDTN